MSCLFKFSPSVCSMDDFSPIPKCYGAVDSAYTGTNGNTLDDTASGEQFNNVVAHFAGRNQGLENGDDPPNLMHLGAESRTDTKLRSAQVETARGSGFVEPIPYFEAVLRRKWR